MGSNLTWHCSDNYIELSWLCFNALQCCPPRSSASACRESTFYLCTTIASVAPFVLQYLGTLMCQVPPGELAERLGVALKLAERRAKKQFYYREDAWAAVSRELYEESMLQIQLEDEDFNRLLRQKFGADPFTVQDCLHCHPFMG